MRRAEEPSASSRGSSMLFLSAETNPWVKRDLQGKGKGDESGGSRFRILGASEEEEPPPPPPEYTVEDEIAEELSKGSLYFTIPYNRFSTQLLDPDCLPVTATEVSARRIMENIDVEIHTDSTFLLWVGKDVEKVKQKEDITTSSVRIGAER